MVPFPPVHCGGLGPVRVESWNLPDETRRVAFSELDESEFPITDIAFWPRGYGLSPHHPESKQMVSVN